MKKLLSVLHRLVDSGNTVIVIEHNLDRDPDLEFAAPQSADY